MRFSILFLAAFISSFNFSNEIQNCNCTDGFVEFCKYDETKNFIGFCSSTEGRRIGKTFYESGTTFEGSYYNDIDSVGTIIWTDGDSFKGELGVVNAGYDIHKSYASSENIIAIGQYVNDTVTSRGFFVLSEKDRFQLIGFGTDFDTDPEADYQYRAGFFEGDNIAGEALIVYNNQVDGPFEVWSDYSIPTEERLFYFIRGKEKRVFGYDSGKMTELRLFNEADEKAKKNIESSIEFEKRKLDNNFEILDDRLKDIDKFFEGNSAVQAKSIKPLSSDLVKSIQELLTILGYEVGKIDGILGPLTIAGIKAYEKAIEISMTGSPTESILIELQESVRLKNNELATAKEPPKQLPIVSTGTGFFIDKNNLVTNYHVVQKCNYLSTETKGLLTIETQDQINDIAILKSYNKSEFFLTLYENPQLGQSIYTGGYPYNEVLDNFNFTAGNVSGLRGTQSNISQFQFTAPVQPGSSGGPILDEKGGVVGVTVSGLGASFAEARNTLPQNIAFGVKVGVLKDILDEEGILFTKGQEFWFSASQERIAQLAKKASIVIQCHSKI